MQDPLHFREGNRQMTSNFLKKKNQGIIVPEVESDSETPYEPDGDYTATMITSHPHIPSPHN